MWLYAPYLGTAAVLAMLFGIVALAHRDRPRS